MNFKLCLNFLISNSKIVLTPLDILSLQQEAGSPEETKGFAPSLKDNPPHPLPKFRLSSAFDSPHKTPLKRTGENSRDGDEVTPFKRSCESDIR